MDAAYLVRYSAVVWSLSSTKCEKGGIEQYKVRGSNKTDEPDHSFNNFGKTSHVFIACSLVILVYVIVKHYKLA